MTFRATVHPETLIGSDAHFSSVTNFNPVVNCTVKPVVQTIIAPISSTISRNAELQHYDLVANAIANSAEYQEQLKQETAQQRPDAFKGIVLLCDVRNQQQDQEQQQQSGSPSSTSSSSSLVTQIWEGRLLDQRLHGGERYFLPSAVHTEPIMFYHYEIKDCGQLYAGRVIAVFGSVTTRDNRTNNIVGVSIHHIVTAPSTGSDLNPNSSLLRVDNRDGKELIAALSKSAPHRIHFCPIPTHFEGEDHLVDDFLRDTIQFLAEARSSSLIVFVGALIGKTALPQTSDNKSKNNNNIIATVQKTKMAQKVRVFISEAASKNPRGAALPLMFVPGVDDLALRPSVIPQSNIITDDKTTAVREHNGTIVHLPTNPAVFYTNRDDSTGLTIVATSIDIQNALLVHSVTKDSKSNPQLASHPRPPRLDVCAETLLQSGLCVPFLQDTQYEEDMHVIEPSSLQELTVTPHIHFSPTSVVSQPQACIQANGTLFVSCNVGPVSFAKGGKCTVMEVDYNAVAPTPSTTSMTKMILTNENVRVRAIDFVR